MIVKTFGTEAVPAYPIPGNWRVAAEIEIRKMGPGNRDCRTRFGEGRDPDCRPTEAEANAPICAKPEGRADDQKHIAVRIGVLSTSTSDRICLKPRCRAAEVAAISSRRPKPRPR